MKKLIMLIAAVISLSSIAAAASALEGDPQRRYLVCDVAYEHMSTFISAFTMAGLTDIPDAAQMPFEDAVWLGFALSFAEDGSPSAHHDRVAELARAHLGFAPLSHRSIKRGGHRLAHEGLRYVSHTEPPITNVRARVHALYSDSGTHLMTGETYDLETGEVLDDFYAHAAPSGSYHPTWTLISLRVTKKPAAASEDVRDARAVLP